MNDTLRHTPVDDEITRVTPKSINIVKIYNALASTIDKTDKLSIELAKVSTSVSRIENADNKLAESTNWMQLKEFIRFATLLEGNLLEIEAMLKDALGKEASYAARPAQDGGARRRKASKKATKKASKKAPKKASKKASKVSKRK